MKRCKSDDWFVAIIAVTQMHFLNLLISMTILQEQEVTKHISCTHILYLWSNLKYLPLTSIPLRVKGKYCTFLLHYIHSTAVVI